MRTHPHSGVSVAHLSSQAQHYDQQHEKMPRQTAMRVPVKAATDRSADAAAARPGGALAQAIFQRPGKLACVLETLFAIPFYRAHQALAEPGRQVGTVPLQRDSFALPERKRAAGEQAIDRHSQRKYLGTLIRRLFSEQLGRHVAGGAAQTIVVGLVDAGQVSEAEVEQFDLATGKQKNVLWLEVAVNDLQCRQILHRRAKS